MPFRFRMWAIMALQNILFFAALKLRQLIQQTRYLVKFNGFWRKCMRVCSEFNFLFIHNFILKIYVYLILFQFQIIIIINENTFSSLLSHSWFKLGYIKIDILTCSKLKLNYKTPVT